MGVTEIIIRTLLSFLILLSLTRIMERKEISEMTFFNFSSAIAIGAIAGNLAGKRYIAPSLGTFPVTTPLFTTLFIGIIIIVGSLTFFPAISLGPILEHLLMAAGKSF